MRSMPLGWRTALITGSLLVLGCDGANKNPVGTGDIMLAEVAAGPQLAFTVEPSTTTAGTAIPTIQVTAQDSLGNTVTSFKGTVTISIGTNPASGMLRGDSIKKAVAGVATFANLNIRTAGVGYTLVAGAAGFANGASSPFDIIPAPASKLVFTVPPTPVIAGDTIAPPVQVSAQDPYGNTATSFNGTIALALRSVCPAGSVLSGTASAAAVNGVASFGDLWLNKSGNCGLKATADSLTAAVASFVVGPDAATQLVVFTKIQNAVAGTPLGSISVVARDRFGNTAAGYNGSVSIAIDSGPVGATLSGTTTVTAASGTAMFSDLVLQVIGSYVLRATADSLTAASSNGFIVKAAPPTHLAFTVQPSNTAPGAHIAPPVQVMVRDAYDNLVKNAGSVTLAIGSNPGGGTLSGTLTKSAASGTATFSNLAINNAGVGYTLVATLGILPSATSAAFNIGSIPPQLAFTMQPSNTAAGQAIAPAVQVTARDSLGNTVTSFSDTVTVSIATNPSGGVLSGTTKFPAISGVATFTDLSINNAGTGYTLQASSGVLTAGLSASFDITVAGDVWATRAAMPTGRFNLAAAASNGTLYAVGGDFNQSALQAYDAAANTWTTKASLLTGRTALGAAMINGILYAVGGRGSGVTRATLEAYDPASDTWTAKTPMPTARQALGVAVINGILYAVGGADTAGNWIATVEAYDPATDSWTTKAPMPTARHSLAVAAVNGILYAVGGVGSPGNYLTTLEAYDPVSNTWTAKAPMPTARNALGAAGIQGIFYAVGGITQSSGFTGVSTLEAYDPMSDTWTTKVPMPTPRLSAGVAALNGLLFVVGGYSNGVQSILEAYQP